MEIDVCWQKGDGAMSVAYEDIYPLVDSSPAVKCYFSRMNQTKKDTIIFEREMYEYLFGQSTANEADILTFSNYRLASDCVYYVSVMVVREVKSSDQWTSIVSYSREFLKRVAPEAFMVSGPRLMAYIFPAGPKVVGIESLKTALEKNYQVAASFGQGQPHPLNDLRRSCDEARIALHYPHVMGTKAEVQYFSDLGIFTPLFSQELEIVKIFCRNTLEPLLDYDTKNDSSLLTTLTELVNSNFNLKETAKNLFIHVNTLYYRIKGIEQLLRVDLSLISTRVNLFTVLKSWDLLYMSGLWDWSPGLRQASLKK